MILGKKTIIHILKLISSQLRQQEILIKWYTACFKLLLSLLKYHQKYTGFYKGYFSLCYTSSVWAKNHDIS